MVPSVFNENVKNALFYYYNMLGSIEQAGSEAWEEESSDGSQVEILRATLLTKDY